MLTMNDILQVKLFQAGGFIKCDVNHLKTHAKATSYVIGLETKDFLRHLSTSKNLLGRFLQIDDKTLRVAYSGGLRGGGCCSSTRKDQGLSMNQTEDHENKVEKIIKSNQRKGMLAAKDVANLMNIGVMEREKVDKLREISPYHCPVTQKIAKLLLKSCRFNEFWWDPIYCEDRSKICTIIRRFLMVGIMKDPNSNYFTQETITKLAKTLQKLHNQLQETTDYSEINILLELRSAINLLSEQPHTASHWKQLIKGCPDILNVIQYPRELSSPSLITTISSYYSTISRIPHADFLHFMLELEIIGTAMIESSEDCKEYIELFISQQITSISILTWEEIYIILHLVTMCIDYSKVSIDFSLKILANLEALTRHETSEVRDICRNVLQLLESNLNQEIRKMAYELHQLMNQKEKIVAQELMDQEKGEKIDANLNEKEYNLNILDVVCMKTQEEGERENIERINDEKEVIIGILDTMPLYKDEENEKSEENRNEKAVIVDIFDKLSLGKEKESDKIEEKENSKSEIIDIFDRTSLDKEEESEKEIDENENDEEGIMDFLELLPVRQEEQIEYKDYTTCVDIISPIIEREGEIIIINEYLNSDRLLMLNGEESMERFPKAIIYAQEKLISDNILSEISEGIRIELLRNLMLTAERLGLNNFNIQDMTTYLKLFLSTRTSSILTVFNNSVKQAQITTYCIEYPRILYLDSSRSNQWEEKLQVKLLSPDDFLEFLQNFRISYMRMEELQEVLRNVGNWSLEIQRSGAVINIKKCSSAEFKLSLGKDLNIQQKIQRLFTLEFEGTNPLDSLAAVSLKFDINSEKPTKYFDHFVQISTNIIYQKQNLGKLSMRLDDLCMFTDYPKSEEFYMNCLNIIKEILIPNQLFLANLYTDLDLLYSNKREHSKSEDIFSKYLHIQGQNLHQYSPDLTESSISLEHDSPEKTEFNDIQEKFFPSSPSDLPYLYMNIANSPRENVEYNKSEDYCLNCLKPQEETLKPNHSELSSLYMTISNLYSEKSDFPSSEEYYLKSLNVQEEILKPNSPQLASLYMTIASLYSEKSDFTSSEQYYLKCRKIQEEILPADHPSLAILYNSLGTLYKTKSDYNSSEKFYLKCLRIQKKILPRNHIDLANLYYNLGSIYSSKQNYSKSEEFYLKSLKIREEILPLDHPDLSSLYYTLGILSGFKRDYGKSEELFLKCLAIRIETLPSNHPDLATLYMNLGVLYTNQADYDKSEGFYLKSLKIREEILPPGHPSLGALYNNLALVYLNKTEYEKSEEFYLKCLKIREEVLPKDHSDIAALYMSLGNLYRSKKEYGKSEGFLMKCLEIQEGVLRSNHPELAMLYMNVGNLYMSKIEYEKSEKFYLRCLRIREEVLPSNHPDLATLYMNLGVLYKNKKELRKSEEFYLKCLKIREEIFPLNNTSLINVRNKISKISRVKETIKRSKTIK